MPFAGVLKDCIIYYCLLKLSIEEKDFSLNLLYNYHFSVFSRIKVKKINDFLSLILKFVTVIQVEFI